MRLCHPPDGSPSPKYKLLCFRTTKKICKEKNALAFNWDRLCHLVLCLRLIPFHLERHSRQSQLTTLETTMIVTRVAKIVNYDCNTFIAQATESPKLHQSRD